MDHTPIRRQRPVQNSEQASALTTPLRLSSGRRRSRGPFEQDEVPEKKIRTSIACTAVRGDSFSTLIDKVADASSPVPPRTRKESGADPIQQPLRTVSSLLASQRANRRKLALRQANLPPPMHEAQKDTDVARQCLVRAQEFVGESPSHAACPSRPDTSGCTGKSTKSSKRILVTKSDEMGTEFLFEGHLLRVHDSEALRDLLMEPNVPSTTISVSSLRAAQSAAREPSKSSARWLSIHAPELKGDAAKAILTFENARSCFKASIAEPEHTAPCPNNSSCPSPRSRKPLLIISAGDEGVDFAFEGRTFRAPDPSAFGVALDNSAKTPVARSLSSIRAAQRVGRRRRPPVQHFVAFATPPPVSDAEAARATLESASSVATPSVEASVR